ncbi:hypothetical protein CRI94_17150 [Longibacter salinarum]|uniref:Uncharacterized protein n=1 Tax=Longibacter salinarum TaxID=1850348 RepID=A0A2A8CTN0_9BACT|nr:hypothetical protein [Longibacter salinarum]PEN10955.1 hypothetical protein CRI94_17150 [Longibacter salinarum]
MPIPSLPDSSASGALQLIDAEQDTPLSRKELVDTLEALADRFRYENINIRLLLTALSAAIHTEEERDLARHVAKFEATRQTAAAQERLLREALSILDASAE